jgi:hypothetical protein
VGVRVRGRSNKRTEDGSMSVGVRISVMVMVRIA